MRDPLRCCQAILLDMDGLLLDSERSYREAWRRAAETWGYSLDEAFLESLFGRHADDVADALRSVLGNGFDRESFFRDAESHWFRRVEEQGIETMPGAHSLLAWMQERALPYALATNSDQPYARLCLGHGGLEEAFPVLVTRDQVARGKPAPDLFLEAARRLEVAPSACLVLEDSETGLRAARASGALPILIQRRPELRARLGAYALKSFPALDEFIDWMKITEGE